MDYEVAFMGCSEGVEVVVMEPRFEISGAWVRSMATATLTDEVRATTAPRATDTLPYDTPTGSTKTLEMVSNGPTLYDTALNHLAVFQFTELTATVR